MRLRDVGEFGLIARIQRAAGARCAGGASSRSVAIGIGDDAAVLRLRAGEEVAVSTDALVEGVHFRWHSQDGRTVGRRLLVAGLSDLAAMGARPLGCTVALSAPPDLPLERVDALTRGLLDESQSRGCPLVGGNLTRSRDTQLVITVLGAVRRGRALRRSGARPGDRILVTGRLGRAALEVARAERGLARIRYVPEPRLRAGRALSALPGRGACIDVSDGLLADLRHVLEASDVAAEVDFDRVPRPRGFEPSCRAAGADPVRLALAGGEDYELLFTVRRGAPAAEVLARRLAVPVTEIGRITPHAAGRPRLRLSGPPVPEGWRHF